MSWQDVQHHYQDYDPCPHGAPSACIECENEHLRRQLEREIAEADELHDLLVALFTEATTTPHGPAYAQVQTYLAARGMP